MHDRRGHSASRRPDRSRCARRRPALARAVGRTRSVREPRRVASRSSSVGRVGGHRLGLRGGSPHVHKKRRSTRVGGRRGRRALAPRQPSSVPGAGTGRRGFVGLSWCTPYRGRSGRRELTRRACHRAGDGLGGAWSCRGGAKCPTRRSKRTRCARSGGQAETGGIKFSSVRADHRKPATRRP